MEGDVIQELSGHSDRVHGLCWAPDGKTIASGSTDGTVRLWEWSADTKTAECRFLLPQGGPVNSVAISGDSELVAATSDDHCVRLWNVVSGDLIACLKGHTGIITSLSLPQRGARDLVPFVLTSSRDGTVKRWGYPPQPSQCLKTYAGAKVSVD